MDADKIIGRLYESGGASREELEFLIDGRNDETAQKLFALARRRALENYGNAIYVRGLIEISSYCKNDCLYCGIRRDNEEVERFDTAREDILAMARWALDNQYGSLTLQSGERQDEEFITFVEGLIRDIKKLSDGKLGLTL